jgi:putative hydrolase of HD superfamily
MIPDRDSESRGASPYFISFRVMNMKIEEIIELAMRGEDLKNLDRTGWTLVGVDRSLVESVAEHSFGVALISLLLGKQYEEEGFEIDLGKTLAMAIIHDLAESRISDIVVDRDAPDSMEQLRAKANAENLAMFELLSPLGGVGESVLLLWDDLTNQSSLEARVVSSSDIIDMLIHAVALERSGVAPTRLASFFETSKQRLEQLNVAPAIDIYKSLLREHEKHVS